MFWIKLILALPQIIRIIPDIIKLIREIRDLIPTGSESEVKRELKDIVSHARDKDDAKRGLENLRDRLKNRRN